MPLNKITKPNEIIKYLQMNHLFCIKRLMISWYTIKEINETKQNNQTFRNKSNFGIR